MLKKHPDIKKLSLKFLDNPDVRDQFILKLTYNSNRIEGSTLTEPDTAAILFDNIALPNKSLNEQLEAKNHQAALNCLFDHIANNKNIDENLILKLHSILMNGIRPDAGAYRNHAVRIIGINLPTANYMSIPDLMPKVMAHAAEPLKILLLYPLSYIANLNKLIPFRTAMVVLAVY